MQRGSIGFCGRSSPVLSVAWCEGGDFNMVWFPMLCLGAENFTHAIQDFFLISNQFKA